MPRSDLVHLLLRTIRQRDFLQQTLEAVEDHLTKSEKIREEQYEKLQEIKQQYDALHNELTNTILNTNVDINDIDLDFSPPLSPTDAYLDLKSDIIDLTD